jgi:hypothetical protein
MARPIYSHELIDPDFAWLIASFQEENPNYALVDAVGLPLVLICRPVIDSLALLPMLPEPEAIDSEDTPL